MKNRNLVIYSIAVLLICIGLSECTSEENKIITVVIDSHYDWYASGDIIFDGIDTFGAVGAYNREFTYEIKRSELSLQQDTYNVTLTMDGADRYIEGTASGVRTYVKFSVLGGDDLTYIMVDEVK